MRTDQAQDRKDIQEALEQDRKAKERQKKYKDQKRYVTEHKIKIGDQVLLERKSTKSNSPYDPDPYTVSQTHGTQITANRGGVSMTRDAQKWKKVQVEQKRDYDKIRRGQMIHNREEDYLDIGRSYQEHGHPPQAVTGAVDRGHGEEAEAGGQQGAARASGAGGRARQPVREAWSFQPPLTWIPPARRQPTTRSMSARRERDKGLYRKT